MTITNGQTITDTDYITTSAGAGDSGKVPKLDASGQLDKSFTGIDVVTGTGVTLSLTTVASQRVVVFAKGDVAITSSGTKNVDVLLNYNSVQKDIVRVYNENTTTNRGFALMYTETPGAATHDITVTCASGTLANVVIIVQKLPA